MGNCSAEQTGRRDQRHADSCARAVVSGDDATWKDAAGKPLKVASISDVRAGTYRWAGARWVVYDLEALKELAGRPVDGVLSRKAVEALKLKPTRKETRYTTLAATVTADAFHVPLVVVMDTGEAKSDEERLQSKEVHILAPRQDSEGRTRGRPVVGLGFFTQTRVLCVFPENRMYVAPPLPDPPAPTPAQP